MGDNSAGVERDRDEAERGEFQRPDSEDITPGEVDCQDEGTDDTGSETLESESNDVDTLESQGTPVEQQGGEDDIEPPDWMDWEFEFGGVHFEEEEGELEVKSL